MACIPAYRHCRGCYLACDEYAETTGDRLRFIQKVVVLAVYLGCITFAWILLSDPFHTVTDVINGSVNISQAATQHTRGDSIFNMGYVIGIIVGVVGFLASCAQREYETEWRRY